MKPAEIQALVNDGSPASWAKLAAVAARLITRRAAELDAREAALAKRETAHPGHILRDSEGRITGSVIEDVMLVDDPKTPEGSA
jgi:exosome complex RNA-binding protein Rrp42 (RNase PH superfamily)